MPPSLRKAKRFSLIGLGLFYALTRYEIISWLILQVFLTYFSSCLAMPTSSRTNIEFTNDRAVLQGQTTGWLEFNGWLE